MHIRGMFTMVPPQQMQVTPKWVIEIELPEAYSHDNAHEVLDRIKDSRAIKKEMRVSLTVKHTGLWSTVKP